MPPDGRALARISARQCRAVSRAQVLACGGTSSWLRSQVRTRRWQRLWPGVYVTVTGPVTWMTRAHGALLYAGRGAALGPRASAFMLGITRRPPRTVDVVVPADRRVAGQPGLRVLVGAPPDRLAGGWPPRLTTVATAMALLADARDEDELVAVLCDAVRAGCGTEELRREVDVRPWVRRRALLVDLLAEVAEGIESPLERRYHHGVERRHGLPQAQLQRRQRLAGFWIRADRVYHGRRVRVELDGALAHPGGRTDADTWRDNEVGISEQDLTLRYRWRHVVGRPCATAAQVARALRSRGWDGVPRPCRPGCPLS
jgi:hypothetical protein